MVNTKCFIFGHKWIYHPHSKYVSQDYRECKRCGCVQWWIEGYY